MSTSKVHHQNQHRKKKYVQEERSAPFPVPIATITRDTPSNNYWYHFTGQIHGDHVLVNYSGDISYLCRMGFFGKGLTSKFSHTVYGKLPYVHLPSEEGRDPDVVRVMRRRMYLKHMKWKKSHDLRSASMKVEETADAISVDSEDREFNSDAEDTEQGMTGIAHMVNTDLQCADTTLDKATHSLHSYPPTQAEHGNKTHIESYTLSQTQDKASTSPKLHVDRANSSPSSKHHGDPWANSSPSPKQLVVPWVNLSAADSWDAMEADEEFWTTEEPSKYRDTRLSNNSLAGNDIDDSQTHSPAKRVKLASDAGNGTDHSKRHSISTIPVATAGTDVFPHQERTNIAGTCKSNIEMETSELNQSNNETDTLPKTIEPQGEEIGNSELNQTRNETEALTNTIKPQYEEMESSELKKSNNENYALTKTNQPQDEEIGSSELNQIHNENDALTKTNQPCVGEMGSSELNKSNNETDALTKTTEPQGEEMGNSDISNNCCNMLGCLPEHINPYCRSDDEDDDGDITGGQDYLVIDDSDVDDHAEVLHKKEKYVWKPVRKKETFHFIEPLVLSFEESYFLSYGLGCLTVEDESARKLTLTDLWCKFCTRQDFLPRYVAYHYFRSKGWVPKPCSLFGTDFLVYKVGPEFYHASYSVIIRTVYEALAYKTGSHFESIIWGYNDHLIGSYEEVEGYNDRKQTWTSFSGLHRITENVAKTLVYCYIIIPSDLSEDEKRSPDCIKRIRARLQMVHRWVSSQERDKERVLEDIS